MRLALKVLVDNALQYSPPEAPLVFSLSMRADGGTLLLLRDGGSGVPQDELAAIFGKQGVRGTNAVGQGSGLGLYMARSVIEVHGGNISAKCGAFGCRIQNLVACAGWNGEKCCILSEQL
ncbi:sensor histidine kinase [Massilia sp. B-10]|nr:sensor histidine kinase [Massilia sp. B-10]